MPGLNRKNFFAYTQVEKSQVQEGSNGFSIRFDSFSEVASFFTSLGRNGAYNEMTTSLGDRGIYDDVASDMARDAMLDHAPGIYMVSFPGWNLL